MHRKDCRLKYKEEEGMRITLVQPYITSAVERQFYNIQSFGLSKELVKYASEVSILTSNLIWQNADRNFNPFKRYEEVIDGFKVAYLPTLGDCLSQPLMPTLIWELAKTRPDAVQVADDFQLSTLATVIWSVFSTKPVFVYQGMYGYVSSLPWLHKLYLALLGKIVYRFSKGFIAKTEAAKEFLVSQGVKSNKIKVVPVGFVREKYYEAKGDILKKLTNINQGRILLNVGRLAPEKDQKTLILAMEIIRRRHPDTYLVILGDGSQKNNLLGLIKEKGLQESVFIISQKIPNEKMNLIYSESFLCLIPATYEIFNMTMLECLACGRPVIACNTGGMADVIKDRADGYLFDEHDYTAVAKYVCSLLEDQDKYREFCRNAKRESEKFDWQVLAKEFIEFYERNWAR